MDRPVVNAPVQGSGQPAARTAAEVIALLWESAVDSFVKSILVLIFGSLAIGIAGGIWEEMAPSRPPGFSGKREAESPRVTTPGTWTSTFNEHRLLAVFGVIFVPTVWFRLVRPGPKNAEAPAPSRLRKIGKKLSEDWFGLIVGNAFGALVSAIVLACLQEVTLARVVWQWLLESVGADLLNALRHLLGAGAGNTVQAWFDWCGENQLKFTFWFFYLAAIVDDLGLPNFKTLGRWLGRRVRNQRRQGAQRPR